VNPSDAFRFALALALLPIMLRIGRRIRFPSGRKAFVYSVLFIILGFGLQAVSPLVPWNEIRVVRHFAFAAGGFCLAWAAWMARRHELGTTGVPR
jgi:hypothetical protein